MGTDHVRGHGPTPTLDCRSLCLCFTATSRHRTPVHQTHPCPFCSALQSVNPTASFSPLLAMPAKRRKPKKAPDSVLPPRRSPRFQTPPAQASAAAAAPAANASSAAANTAEPAGPEFAEPRRLEILTELRGVLVDSECKWSTAWACLWLADLSWLEEFLRRARNEPGWAALFLAFVDEGAVVKACKSSHHSFLLLIVSRAKPSQVERP